MNERNEAHATSGDRLLRYAAVIALMLAVAFQVLSLFREWRDPPAYTNDRVLHRALIEGTAAAWARGDDPTDWWLSSMCGGFPVVHHYQHLPHLVLGTLRYVSGVGVETLITWSSLLLLCALPLSVAWSLARLGAGAVGGTLAGVCVTLLSTPGLYGLEVSSFGWNGHGLFTQLWGVVLGGPALALLARAVRDGRGVITAGIALGVLIVTHTVVGYVAAMSAPLFAVVDGVRDVPRRLGRLAMVACVSLACCGWFVIPFWLDRAAMNRSVYEAAEKYDSVGLTRLFERLLTVDSSNGARGDLFDHPSEVFRLPVVTLLVLAGLALCFRQWRRRASARILPVLFVVWFLYYAGRATFGGWIDVIPGSGMLHQHRLIVPVQLAGCGLAGLALAQLLAWVQRRSGRLGRVGRVGLSATVLALVVASPVVERARYYAERASWIDKMAAVERPDDHAAFDDATAAIARQSNRGRVYAGQPTTWGKQYQVDGVPVFARLVRRGLDTLSHTYHTLAPMADLEGPLDESRLEIVNLLHVQYILAPVGWPAPPFSRAVAKHGRHVIHVAPNTGWCDLIDVPEGAYGGSRAEWHPAMRAWMDSAAVRARVHPRLVVDGLPGGASSARPIDEVTDALRGWAAPRQPRGAVRDVASRPGRYEVEVDAVRDCHVMLKANYHPGWRVDVDGEAIDPIMVAPAYVAVPVKAGEHRVTFRYTASPLRVPLALGGVVSILVVAWLGRRRTDLSGLVAIEED